MNIIDVCKNDKYHAIELTVIDTITFEVPTRDKFVQ